MFQISFSGVGDIESFTGLLQGGGTQSVAFDGIREGILKRGSNTRRAFDQRYQPAGFSITDDFRKPAGGEGDHRDAAGTGFDCGHAEGLHLGGRSIDIGGGVEGGQQALGADKALLIDRDAIDFVGHKPGAIGEQSTMATEVFRKRAQRIEQ